MAGQGVGVRASPIPCSPSEMQDLSYSTTVEDMKPRIVIQITKNTTQERYLWKELLLKHSKCNPLESEGAHTTAVRWWCLQP